MAKQRGLHQIKGKVGEYSYYSQTGVSGGLIRKINEGLSSRVKSDAAYANTRLNNQEFGAAADTSALLGKCVVPKFRPMILPFSQAKMARDILKVAREHVANWGQRVVTSDDTAKLCEILTSMSKRDFTEFAQILVTPESATQGNFKASLSAAQCLALQSLGATSVTITMSVYNVATGQWIPAAQEMATGYLNKAASVDPFINEPLDPAVGLDGDNDASYGTFVPEANHAAHRIVVAVLMPSRTVNDVDHILQEYCSFIAIPLPANA